VIANTDLHPASVPTELTAVAQWLTWRREKRAAKPTKVPYSAITRALASTTDHSTWATFEEAVATWRAGGFDGIGFVFSETDPYCGVDLDDCLDSAGELDARARRIVERLATYTEVSPSGRGVKLFVRGTLPSGRRRRGNVEIYDRGRYFTVTGRHLSGTPTTIEERQRELEALHVEIFTAPAARRAERPSAAVRPPAEDAQLLARARSARNGRKFMDLYYRGDLSPYGGDDSSADLALCCLLAFWCGRDPGRIDRLFRQSALMREKWDSRRGDTTYGALTIGKALGAGRGR
jgi:primase-polymerase (primpol)-like protein